MRARDVVARSVGLILAIGLWLAPGLPASGQAEPASSRHLAPAAPPQHGGGGFALLLLDHRVALERVIEDLRGRTADLAAGVEMAPAEMMAAVHRVTAGADPVPLVAGLLAILGMAFLVHHAVRWRLAGEQPAAASDASDGFGARLGRALYRALVDLLALGAFARGGGPGRDLRAGAGPCAHLHRDLPDSRAGRARRGAGCAFPARPRRARRPPAAAARSRGASSIAGWSRWRRSLLSPGSLPRS